MWDKIILFYKRKFIVLETFFGIGLGFFVYFLGGKLFLSNAISENFIYTRIQSLVGLLGFLIATISIILTLKDGPKLEKLQKSGQYHKVIDIYINTMKWIGFWIITWISLVFINNQHIQNRDGLLLVINVIILSIKLFRCIWITDKLFRLTIPS